MFAQGGFLKVKTAFRRKSTAKRSSAPTGMSATEKKYEIWDQYSAIINPQLKPVVRTPEDIEEARRMTKMYNQWNMNKDKWFHQTEQARIRLMTAAFNELPEDEKDFAATGDESPIPENFIFSRITAPVVGEILFGDCQKPGYFSTISEYGHPPVIGRDSVRNTPF